MVEEKAIIFDHKYPKRIPIKVFLIWNHIYPFLVDNTEISKLADDGTYKVDFNYGRKISLSTNNTYMKLVLFEEEEKNKLYIQIGTFNTNSKKFKEEHVVFADDYVLDIFAIFKKYDFNILNKKLYKILNNKSDVRAEKKELKKEFKKEQKKQQERERLKQEEAKINQTIEDMHNKVKKLCDSKKIKCKFDFGDIFFSTPFGQWKIAEEDVLDENKKIVLYHKNKRTNTSQYHHQKFNSKKVEDVVDYIYRHDYKQYKIDISTLNNNDEGE